MPYRMHSEYLRRLFLDNDLCEGPNEIGRKEPNSFGDTRAPLFIAAIEKDHVAPWRSGYNINLLEAVDTTFILTIGGYKAGTVSEPGHRRQTYRVSRRPVGGRRPWRLTRRRRGGAGLVMAGTGGATVALSRCDTAGSLQVRGLAARACPGGWNEKPG